MVVDVAVLVWYRFGTRVLPGGFAWLHVEAAHVCSSSSATSIKCSFISSLVFSTCLYSPCWLLSWTKSRQVFNKPIFCQMNVFAKLSHYPMLQTSIHWGTYVHTCNHQYTSCFNPFSPTAFLRSFSTSRPLKRTLISDPLC